MTAVIETELKLRGTPAALGALAVIDHLGPATLGAARTADELDVYLDTAEGALAAARWACRLRARDGLVPEWRRSLAPSERPHRRTSLPGADVDHE